MANTPQQQTDWSKFTPVKEAVDWSQFTPIKKATAAEKAVDLGRSVASGAIGQVKAIADSFGAVDNAASKQLGSWRDSLQSGMSEETKAAKQRQSAILDEAKGKDTLDQVVAGGKAFMEAPGQTIAEGVGSIAPYLLTGGASAVGTGVRLGMGVASGLGTAKSAIADEVQKREVAAGRTPEQAKTKADEAQSYGGPNTDQILLGGALGAADSLVGATPAAVSVLQKLAAKKAADAAATGLAKEASGGILKSAAKGALSEMPTEFAQGGQEQLAANIGAQRAGYDANTWDGVFSNATLEALASAGPGAGLGALDRSIGAPVRPVDGVQGSGEVASGQASDAVPVSASAVDSTNGSPVDVLGGGVRPVEQDAPADGGVGTLGQQVVDPETGEVSSAAMPPAELDGPRGFQPIDVTQMTDGQLEERKLFLKGQANNNGGWSKALIGAARDIDKEQKRRAGDVRTGAEVQQQDGAQAGPVVDPVAQDPAQSSSTDPVIPGSNQPAQVDSTQPARKPSEVMGLNPSNGPLSASAVVAVDSGAHQSALSATAQVTADEQPKGDAPQQNAATPGQSIQSGDVLLSPGQASGTPMEQAALSPEVQKAANIEALKQRLQGGQPLQIDQPQQQQQSRGQGSSKPLLSDDEAAMLGDFERMYQADLKADIRTRLGLAPKADAGQELQPPKMTPFKSFLRDAGISSSLAADITGANAVDANRRLPGAFRRNGMNLDMLVQRAKEQGFMSQADEDSGLDNGGVNKLVQLIQQEFSGNPVQRLENAASNAQSMADNAMRQQLEQKADALGLGSVGREMSSDRLNSLIKRIEARMGRPVRTDFNGRKLMRSEARKEREAILFANKVENERLRYEAEIQAFAEESDGVQDAVLDVFTDENGDVVIVNERDADAELAARTLNGTWSDQNGQETSTTQDSRTGSDTREDSASVPRGSDQGAQVDQANRSEAGSGSQEGLTTYTPAEVTARQDAAKEAEATAQRAEDAAASAEAAAKQAKEIAQRSVAAADTFELGQSAEDNLSGQGGLFSRNEQQQNQQAAPDFEAAMRLVAQSRRDTFNAVKSLADEISAKWKNAPEVVVVRSMQDAAVPESVRDSDAKQKSQGATGEPEGFFYKGKVYLVSSELKSRDDVIRVLFHEALGHYGLRGVFGDKLKQVLRQVATMRKAEVMAKANEYGLDFNQEASRLMAAEEVLSDMAQKTPNVGFVKQAIGIIRGWMRENIPGFSNLKMTDDEIVARFILPARRFVERGRGGADGGANGVAMFSRTTTAKTQESQQPDAFSIKNATADQLAHYRGMGMQFLGQAQIVDLYSDMIPELKTYERLVHQMDADKNEAGAEADKLATEWAGLNERAPGLLGMKIGAPKYPGMERKLAELMHDATLAGVDPDKPLPDAPKSMGRDAFTALHERKVHADLKARFDALSPKAQDVYRRARDMYADHFKKVREAITEKIERSGMDPNAKAKMIAKMDADLFGRLKGVYFPLARFGNYVVVSKNAVGEVVGVSRAETMPEANQMRRELVKNAAQGVTVSRVYKDAEFNAARDGVGKGFVADLMKVLQDQGVGEDVLDSVGQLYLSSLPDLSWAKHGLHRKGTPGFSQDARRAFAQNMFHGARHLAKLRYSDRLADSLMDMDERINDRKDDADFDPVKAQQVVDEMNKRHELLMNPKTHPMSTAMTSVGFVYFMGLSPASALVNLTQNALVAYPVMASKWGFNKAGKALLNSSREVMKAGNDLSKALKGDELAAFQKAVNDGTIDVTMAHDLAGIAQGEDQKVAWAMRPVMRAASYMFHHAEKFNRQSTFIAAYRLAREAGVSPEVAYEQAKTATYEGHFNYSACVDDATEILTTSGWKRRTELFVGDVAIATDRDGKAVESKVLAVNVYEGEKEVIEFKSSRKFSMVLTPNHDAIVQNYNSRDKKWQAIRKVRADELKSHHFIVRTPLAAIERDGGGLGDDMAALLGWIAAEGCYSRYRKTTAATDVRLSQSVTHNPKYVAEIRGILQRLGGEFKEYTYERKRDTLTTFVLRRALGRRVQEQIPEKVLTSELVASMSTSEMKSFLMAFLKGDGTCYKNGRSWAVAQKNGVNLDLLQAMATMCGMRATLSPVNGRGIGFLYVVPDDTGARSHVRPLVQTRRTEPLVWCPTTEHGTWIARRNGAVFVTGNSNRPRVMQGNWQKVIFLFRQYGQNMVYTLTRQAYLATKGMNPEERTQARKQLAGILVMHAMAAGALGLPVVGMLLSAASMIGGSDDEPWDAEVALKNMLAETFGTQAADVMAHGLSRLTPWDISGRVALNKLILPDIQEGLEGQRWGESIQSAMLGPVAGIVPAFAKGLQTMGNGDYTRGLEEMLPVVLKGPLKAMRYELEGAKDKTGIVIKDEVGLASVIGQAFGLSPTEVRLATEGKAAIYQFDSALKDRRSELMRQFALAQMADDKEGVADVMEKVRAFNEKNPDLRITVPNLMQSARERTRRIEKAEQGIYLPENRKGAMKAGAFAATADDEEED